MYSDIFSHLVTTTDRTQFLNRLAEFERIQYQDLDTPLEQKMNECFGSEAPVVASLVKDTGEGALKALAQAANDIPVCTITLAFEPTRSHMYKLRDTIATLAATSLVLNVVIDASLVGGAILSWNGKYFDGSVGTKLHEYFKTV